MRYLISIALVCVVCIALAILWKSGHVDGASPPIKVCSSREPLELDREIDKLSLSAFTSELLSFRALGGQKLASADDFLVYVQQGIYAQYRWPAGNTITIAFLSGDPTVQQRIQDSAMTWTKHANIKLAFTKDVTAAAIRIGIDLNGMSESEIGNQALKVPKGKETMHFGWLTKASSQAEVDSVVLHEFGHVLGNVHEHQLPNTNIAWNKDFVYKYCENNWHWKKEDVDHNIFEKYTPEQLVFTRMDPQSIMMYSFPKEWTTNGVSTPWNYKLSAEDTAFIARFYPPPK
jgi:serralysin